MFVPKKISASCERLEGGKGGEDTVVAGRQGMTMVEVTSLVFGVLFFFFSHRLVTVCTCEKWTLKVNTQEREV